MSERNKSDGPLDPLAKPAYESPEIEEIVTPAEFEREVHYAGGVSQGPG